MEKRLIVILLIILCGCRQRTVACSRYINDDRIEINIEAINDDISTVEVSEIFTVPGEIMASEERLKELERQFDSSCHLEDNHLIRRYALCVNGTYSLDRTLDQLRKEKYFCE